MRKLLYAFLGAAALCLAGCRTVRTVPTIPAPNSVIVNGVEMPTFTGVPDTDFYEFPLTEYHEAKVRLISDSIVEMTVPNGEHALSWGIMPGGYQRRGDNGIFPISMVMMGGMTPDDTIVNSNGTISFRCTFMRPGRWYVVNPYLRRVAPIRLI